MATVTNSVRLPDGTIPARVDVQIRLVASTTTETGGFRTSDDREIAGRHQTNTTTGAWTVDLEPNANITPAGTVYEIRETVNGVRLAAKTISVPTAGGAVNDLLVDPPAALPSSPLQAHLDDTVDAHDASAVSFAAASGFVATDAQAAIVEARADGIAAGDAAQANLTAHISNPTGAHAASAVSFAPTANVLGTTVQAALQGLRSTSRYSAELLVDTFPGAAVDTSKWTPSADTVVTGGRARMQATAVYQYDLQSKLAYNLVGSHFAAKLERAPAGADNTVETYLELIHGAADHSLVFMIAGTTLTMRFRSSGANSDTGITYSATDHAWLRFVESGGNVTFDTSPDGITWTTRRTVTPAWTPDNMFVAAQAAYWGSPGAGPFYAYLDNVNGDPTWDATANAPTVLKFDGTTQTVNHGQFWPTGVNLTGGFSWEAWVRFDAAQTGYWISEGYGGAHAILAGFSGSAPAGNVWTGAATTSFTADYAAQPGEWLHVRVGWDGTTLYTWVNGIITSAQAWAGPRQAQQGALYIGGSDHLNLNGAIAAVRGFEGALPSFRGATGSSPYYAFRPERALSDATLQNEVAASFVAHYTTRGQILVPDHSPAGYNGRRHAGRVAGSANGFSRKDELPSWPGPQYVSDRTCPFRLDADPARVRATPTAPATPTGAKIFDSFSRADSIMAYTVNPTLGQTEAGSLGPLTWQRPGTAGDPTHFWGVFNGRAAYQGTDYARTWVANNSADMDVRVDRRLVAGLHNTGLLLRVQDGNNYLQAFTTGASLTGASVTLGVGNGGAGTSLATWACPATNWATLRVVASGTTITGYVDDLAGGWTQIGQATGVTNFQTSTGAGLFGYWDEFSARRWDNFTVL